MPFLCFRLKLFNSSEDQFIFQPCLAACEDQVHKFLVTHASYPNEDSFVGTVAFCNLLQKLVILLLDGIFLFDPLAKTGNFFI
jgi:hypothetical protein